MSIPAIDYKFSEDTFLDECRAYIDSTYSQHYAGNPNSKKNIQLMELMGSNGELAFHFAQGAALKYALRYGKKSGYNKKDLLKAMHYLIFMNYYTPESENATKS
jgi:hypothetical protein